MHLRSLRLRGFKSFPDQVEIAVEPGVAVVVGPNGSGKSNVADAIVWAAGSLAPSELRAERPDDVLFAGGGDRRAADHCEVELVFDNTDGALGQLDYSEVSIARRLVRGGEGVYLVNRTPVRRIDVVELLADVGLGGAMHSIVGQGKVDAVLASKPEDRRALVEEAAGLGKFKRRKHRADLKLARVATQVERARDFEDEVRKRLRPLALQATAAERAEKLVVEIAGLRARIADLDLAAIAERRAEAEERRDAAAIARRRAQERLSALLEERQSAEDELSDAAGRRETALGALYRLQGASERLALRREAAGSLEARLRANVAELERDAARRGVEALRPLQEEAERAAARARGAAAEQGRTAERARIAHARLAALDRKASAAAEERLASLAREREAVEVELAELATGRDALQGRQVALGGARERLLLRADTAGTLASTLAAEAREAVALASRGDPSPEELEQRANEAGAAARAAATERDVLAERARAARERLAALEAALAEREGLPPAARALADEGEQLVVSLVEVPPGSERAAAAALAWRASALLADDAGAGLALLERARDAGLGTLAVLVGADPARLVESLPIVSLNELHDSTTTAVTREGFGYDPERGELWFAGETAEAVFLEMDSRRRALSDEAKELADRADAAAQAAGEAAETAARAEAAYAPVAHVRGRATDPAAAERLSGGAAALRELAGRAAALAARLEHTASAGLAVAAERSAELSARLRGLAAAEAAARHESAEAAERARAAEVVVAQLGGGTHVQPGDADRGSLAREAQELLQAAEAAASAARDAADSAAGAEAALLGRGPRRSALDPDLLERLCAAAAGLGASLEGAARVADRLESPVRARVDAGALRTSELGAELRRLGAGEVELRQAAEEASERATAVQVELARLDADQAEATRRRELAGDAEPAAAEDREALAARAQRLDARREELGKVNPLAKEAYEAEKLRLDELVAQRADLEESLAEIAKLRDELADTVQRRFSETFAAVAANFEEVAATLFPDGEGRLRLVEPDEENADAGIEVELQPAGKRITRLSLLSGGEKALGAISFLFALFLAKPCPFYLLDEVEAALDDTNIARFVELLRRYADRAQFVVITHQKRTMEAADVLYGVTMGSDGVSEVVSRRLPRAEARAAAVG